jgi:hypothetical protein
LQSKSDNPVVAANRDVLHKIGVTSGKVETRIANAKLDPTFLMADVEIVATYKLSNINRTKLEKLIHRIFDPARLNIEIKDRFGNRRVTPLSYADTRRTTHAARCISAPTNCIGGGGGVMAKTKGTPKFSTKFIEAVANSLPSPAYPRRRKLLPKVFQEWYLTDRKEHLSRESRAILRQRTDRLELIANCARQLFEVFNGVDERTRTAILAEIVTAEGRRVQDISRIELSDLSKQLKETPDFLLKLSAIAPKKPSPRKLTPYFILLDTAAIFEWYSGTEATREVSRDGGKEIGDFYRFARFLWQIVFGNGDGLPAAMKNWAKYRKQFGERSVLITNIALRYPTWRVYDR